MAQRIDVRYVHYYTDGSAARKLAPVQPFKTMKLPKPDRRNRLTIRIDPIAVAGILMAAVMMVMLVVGAVELTQARQDAQQMENYVHQLRADNRELTVTYKHEYTLEEVQRTADALGLIPKEQATHLTLEMPQEQVTLEEPDTLDRFYTFLTSLFA